MLNINFGLFHMGQVLFCKTMLLTRINRFMSWLFKQYSANVCTDWGEFSTVTCFLLMERICSNHMCGVILDFLDSGTEPQRNFSLAHAPGAVKKCPARKLCGPRVFYIQLIKLILWYRCRLGFQS